MTTSPSPHQVKLHANEANSDAAMVRRLIDGQFPQWAHLPITPVGSVGTVNVIYRLGEDFTVRLPRLEPSADEFAEEQRWLSWLAPQLPLAIPEVVGIGRPAEGYPLQWSVTRWLAGRNLTCADPADQRRLAADLGEFVSAMWGLDATIGPHSHRGGSLTTQDAEVRAALAALAGSMDIEAAEAAWQAALDAPAWDGPPRWIHGDIMPGNLLWNSGRLSAVIDFECMGVGDPAIDMIGAWNVLSADARDTFRQALAVDDATWARGRGWALSIGLVALPYYRHTNPAFAAVAQHQIDQVLTEHS